MKIPSASKRVSVAYEALGGVDLSTQARYVSPNRSPDMKNMIKTYTDGYSDFLETRPGRTALRDFGAVIHGLYFYRNAPVIHAGTGLYRIDGEYIGTLNDGPSVGFVCNDRLWLLDGQEYYVYDGYTLQTVEGFVPTTSVGRAPSGGGTLHQPVNLLTNRRINTFRSDGKTTVYALDATDIEEVILITVDGMAVSNYTVQAAAGTVTFATAPKAASGGDDNVTVTFSTTFDSFRQKLTQCHKVCLFDNRIFVAGGEKGIVRHSRLDDPTYFADTDFYKVGECEVTALAAGEGCLYAFTEQGITRHEPSLDYELGRVYPRVDLAVTVGCQGFAAPFLDDMIWLSARGVEGLSGGWGHRSTLIDTSLTNRRVQAVAVWGSFLCLLADGLLFLADGRAPYRIDGRREYEWFVWDAAVDNVYSDGQTLYWSRGSTLGIWSGTDDEGQPIESYFCTRDECAGDPAVRKRADRVGAVALLKRIANADVTVSTVIDGSEPKELCTFHLGGMNFNELDFATLSFTNSDQDLVRLPLHVKDYLTLALRFSSTRRFGVAAVRYGAEWIRYVK